MANTIAWLKPATGAVDPTAAAVAAMNETIVNLTSDGTLTTQTLTHNMNISAADLALGYPHVTLEPGNAAAFSTFLPVINLTTGKTANTVVITFAAVVGIVKVRIARPNTLVQ